MKMAENFDESRGEDLAGGADDRVVSDRVQELTWALLDEEINDDEFRLLENLLLSDDKCRDSYIGCVQLHADLLTHFAAPKTKVSAKSGSSSPILGFLPTCGFPTQSTEEASS
jgi:hypothetical protein